MAHQRAGLRSLSPSGEAEGARLLPLIDHLRRSAKAGAGFQIFGINWLRPWVSYLLGPALRRVLDPRTIGFRDFQVRSSEADLYTFANLFEDYDRELLERSLPGVQTVIDGGANVGAFSLFALKLATRAGARIRITAVEPHPGNFAFLSRQPFAGALNLVQAAVGPATGRADLVVGINSATHSVNFEGDTGTVPVVTLRELCSGPTFLKLDVEGSEWQILQGELPREVIAMFLEWHVAVGRPADPRELVPGGTWTLKSRDPYGNSTWSWTRN